MRALVRRPIHRALAGGLIAGTVAAVTIVASSSATPRAGTASGSNGTYLVWGTPKSGQSVLARRVMRVNQITYGVGRGISSPTGSQTPQAGRLNVSEVSFTKALNNDTSPRLLQALISGQAYHSVLIKFVKHGHSVLTTKLSDVLVSGYSISSGGDVPSETISLNFAKIEFKVGKQTTPPGAVNPAGWDLTAAASS